MKYYIFILSRNYFGIITTQVNECGRVNQEFTTMINYFSYIGKFMILDSYFYNKSCEFRDEPFQGSSLMSIYHIYRVELYNLMLSWRIWFLIFLPFRERWTVKGWGRIILEFRGFLQTFFFSSVAVVSQFWKKNWLNSVGKFLSSTSSYSIVETPHSDKPYIAEESRTFLLRKKS